MVSTDLPAEAPKSAGLPAGAWMLVVAVSALASRAVAFSGGLVYDDYLTLLHRDSTGWGSALVSFVHNQSQGFGSNFYRPVLTVWYEGFFQLLHTNAAGWHTVANLLHMVCALLVFCLAAEMGVKLPQAAAIAMLFSVHPAHVGCVNWISAMGDPLMTCFLLASGICLLHWLHGGKSVYYLASLVAALGCVFTKETGVIFPVLTLAAACVLPAEQRVRKLSLGTVAPFFLISLGFLAVRRMVLPAFSSPVNHCTTVQMIATWPSALLFYLRHLVWPEAVVPFYPLSIADGFNLRQFWLPLLLLTALLCAIGVTLWRTLGARRAVFCLVWTFVPLAPVMMLKVFASFELVQDRFLYVPVIGFCAALVWLLQEVTRRLDAERSARVFLVCVTGLAVLWGIRALSEGLWWQNDRALFTRALEITPDNPRAMVNLADAYMKANRTDDAVPLFQKAIAISPDINTAHFGLGLAAYRRGELQIAEAQLIEALRLLPRHDEWEFLARTELELGKLDVAERAARAAALTSGKWPGAHEALGEVLLAKGDRAGAIQAFQQELRVSPNSQLARAGLAKAQGAAAP